MQLFNYMSPDVIFCKKYGILTVVCQGNRICCVLCLTSEDVNIMTASCDAAVL
jgi:hypothetical protein